jgi:hypothetical protein
MLEIWHPASPFWRLELPPYDDEAVLVDPSLWGGFPAE